jgi:lipopolysaccharide/colanic/teichoic acid biosynthesis glycosyltransferase
MKEIFDKTLALLLLILFSPIFLTLSLLIYIIMGKPIFFRQERPGLNGKIFKIYKFRTMSNERDENGELLSDEKRLKGIGKFIRSTSLDELPQLINVLKGDMSFVGPRPLLVEYLELYDDEQKRRHNVKPGITGLAQINGRNAISWEEKFKLDVCYVDNQSFLLDMKILWMTFLKVLKRDGISSAKSVTMEKFKGSSKNEK